MPGGGELSGNWASVLCQNESQAAASIKEAKAVCSQVTLDAQTTCSWLILEAKTACSMAVKKAKTTRGCLIQEAKDTCSKAISETEAQRASQAASFQREHGNIMQDLEEQVIQEESRSQADFLSACQVTLYYSPPELKSTLATSYHILLGQTPPVTSTHPATEDFPCGRTAHFSCSPMPSAPKQSPRPKRWHPSPDPVESMAMGRTTLKATLGGPPSSKR